jgi:TolA-binding protein
MEMNSGWRLLAVGFLAATIFPCAVDTSPSFVPLHRPEKFDSAFVRGNLGIIPSTLSEKYKLIAWRYLAGLPLDKQEQAAVIVQPIRDNSLEPEAWGRVRQSAGLTIRFFNTGKASRVEPGTYYVNCLPDAFTTAARTYSDRQQRYANKNLLTAWLTAQDTVFRNCDAADPPEYPSDPDPGMTPLARADRKYQIAAAHFYAEDLDGAENRFRAIAADNDSPWQDTAGYMVARTLIRENSLLHKPGALAQARVLLQKIASAPLHDSAQGLVGYIDTLTDPASELKSLGERLAVPHPGPTLSKTIDEATFVLTSARFQQSPANPVVPEPFEWIAALESDKVDYSIQRWKQSGSNLWLAAALINADTTEKDAVDLIEAGLKVPQSSPAFDTVTFHSIRLMIRNGRGDEARRRLDVLLGGKRRDLNSVDNAFRAQRMSVATSFDDFLRWASRRPIGIAEDDFDPGSVDGSPILESDSVEVFNYFAPLRKLVEAAGSNRLPVWPRTQIAITAWTRAFVLGDDDAANRVIPILAKAHPAWTPDLEAFRDAAGAQKRFAGALLIARHGDFHIHLWSDFRPQPGTGGFGPDWWCAGDLPDQPSRDLPETVLSKDDRAEAAREGRQVKAAGDDKAFLAPIVMSWSRAHPDDPRVPEALHRLVRITRYGCRSASDNGSISKAAFRILHERYPGSAWARQTPYWFN